MFSSRNAITTVNSKVPKAISANETLLISELLSSKGEK